MTKEIIGREPHEAGPEAVHERIFKRWQDFMAMDPNAANVEVYTKDDWIDLYGDFVRAYITKLQSEDPDLDVRAMPVIWALAGEPHLDEQVMEGKLLPEAEEFADELFDALESENEQGMEDLKKEYDLAKYWGKGK